MACDEGEKGEEGGESGQAVVKLHPNNPQIQVREEYLQIISAATSPPMSRYHGLKRCLWCAKVCMCVCQAEAMSVCWKCFCV